MRAELMFVLAATLSLAPAVTTADDDLPSGDFLEYLGALVDDDGDWVHPEDLDNGDRSGDDAANDVSALDDGRDEDSQADGEDTA